MVDLNTRLVVSAASQGGVGAVDVSIKEIIDAATVAMRTELGLGTLAVKSAVANTDLAGGFAKAQVVAGGAAGNFTVTGIKTTDELVGVVYFTKSTNLTAVTDLKAEFTITADNTINNTAGTASTGGYLMVFWNKLH